LILFTLIGDSLSDRQLEVVDALTLCVGLDNIETLSDAEAEKIKVGSLSKFGAASNNSKAIWSLLLLRSSASFPTAKVLSV
jgi:hypothetical protein